MPVPPESQTRIRRQIAEERYKNSILVLNSSLVSLDVWTLSQKFFPPLILSIWQDKFSRLVKLLSEYICPEPTRSLLPRMRRNTWRWVASILNCMKKNHTENKVKPIFSYLKFWNLWIHSILAWKSIFPFNA